MMEVMWLLTALTSLVLVGVLVSDNLDPWL